MYAFCVKCGQMWIIFSWNMKKFHRKTREEETEGGIRLNVDRTERKGPLNGTKIEIL